MEGRACSSCWQGILRADERGPTDAEYFPDSSSGTLRKYYPIGSSNWWVGLQLSPLFHDSVKEIRQAVDLAGRLDVELEPVRLVPAIALEHALPDQQVLLDGYEGVEARLEGDERG